MPADVAPQLRNCRGHPMPRKDILSRLYEIANRLSKIHPEGNAEIAIVNLMAGATYALHQAAELDYDDNRANPNPDGSK